MLALPSGLSRQRVTIQLEGTFLGILKPKPDLVLLRQLSIHQFFSPSYPRHIPSHSIECGIMLECNNLVMGNKHSYNHHSQIFKNTYDANNNSGMHLYIRTITTYRRTRNARSDNNSGIYVLLQSPLNII